MEKIKEWVESNLTSKGEGDGDGSGYGCGHGSDCGSGYGSGSGCGCGHDDGYGYGSGCGCGCGSDSGYGYGYDYSDDYGCCYGDGDGSGLKFFGNDEVFLIDEIQTIIKSAKGNTAKGFIIGADLTLKPCFVVKGNGLFAHGSTLREANKALQEKIFEGLDEDERIAEFVKKFPVSDKKYSNEEFFDWHNKLTGSCLMGREQFAKEHDVDLKGKMTVVEFITLTENAYGGKIVKKLKESYKEKRYGRI